MVFDHRLRKTFSAPVNFRGGQANTLFSPLHPLYLRSGGGTIDPAILRPLKPVGIHSIPFERRGTIDPAILRPLKLVVGASTSLWTWHHRPGHTSAIETGHAADRHHHDQGTIDPAILRPLKRACQSDNASQQGGTIDPAILRPLKRVGRYNLFDASLGTIDPAILRPLKLANQTEASDRRTGHHRPGHTSAIETRTIPLSRQPGPAPSTRPYFGH